MTKAKVSPAAGEVDEGDPDVEAPLLSEDAFALNFAKQEADNLRYVHQWGNWLWYDGRKWNKDTKLRAYSMVRKLCRFEAQNTKPLAGGKIASAKTVAAVERLAKSDERLAASTDQWDTDKMVLNTPDGVVDLRTGKISESRPEYFMTKMTAVGPGGDCPQFKKFLQEIMDNDEEMIRYLQRIFGYGLTGMTKEQALFFLFGKGKNGKGRLLYAMTKIMGNYHKSTPPETLAASNHERHPTELAELHNVRLVTVSETEQGKYWAESRIKQLTGDDPVSARFMRQDFFDYDPQFKLVITGQHKPHLRHVDEAIRRRVNMIPFSVTIPEAKRDYDLDAKLEAEWPGILAWMIEGCLEWQQIGLAPPKKVTHATKEYLENENVFERFLDECCYVGVGRWTTLDALFVEWKLWAKQNNHAEGSSRAFGDALENADCPRERRKLRGHIGISLTEREPSPENPNPPHKWTPAMYTGS